MSDDDGIETVAGGAALVFGGRLAKLALLFAFEVLLARLLGADGYGSVVLAVTVVGIGSLFGTVGIDTGLTRLLPETEDDERRARGVVRAGVLVTLVAGTLLGVGAFLAAPVVAGRVFGDPGLTPLVRVAAVGLPFSVVGNVGVAVARSSRDATAQVLVRQLLEPASKLLLAVGLVALGYGAFGAMVGIAVTFALGAVAALVLARRALSFPLRGPTEPMRRRLVVFSVPLLFAASVDYFIGSADTFLVGVFRPAAEVSVYNVAYQLRALGLVFFFPFTYLLPPAMARLVEDDDRAGARQTYQVITKWMTLATTPLAVGLFLFPGVVIRTAFGGGYVAGAPVLRLLAVPVFVTVLFGANGAGLVALGHNRSNLYVNAGAASLNLGLNLLLIPRLGILGAAVASTVGFVSRDLAYTALLYRWEAIGPFRRATFCALVPALAVAALGYPAFLALFPERLPYVAAAGVGYLAVYTVAVVAFGLEPADDRLLRLVERRAGVEFTRLRASVDRLRR